MIRAFGILPALLAAGLARGADAPEAVDFNRDVRPILSETCFQCHGPDQKKRKADLRLDTKEGLFHDFGEYQAIVPGKPDESELYLRVSSEDESDRMPPPKFAKSLTKKQVETIRKWIEEGAEWKGHWAYHPPTRPDVPRVHDPSGFVRNDIDRFVLAKLEEIGLKPSPEADRPTLIRRLSFDLTGLPPTPEEVDAFVRDRDPRAYETLVDRLLASPHFGERMAAYWLDLVRYADSCGYHSDTPRNVYLFRDYVIKAFNQNLPFDRFTVEQLAGDLLPDPTDDQKIASGYNRLLQTTEEGGAQAKEYTAKYAADRVRNVGSVWLASTLGCSECHDHKFDPFLTREFYSFEAFFADLKEAPVGRQEEVKMPTADQKAELREIDRKLAEHQRVIDTPTPALAAAQEAWEKSISRPKTEWTVLPPVKILTANGTKFTFSDDGSVLATGANPEKGEYTVVLKVPPRRVTALRLEVLPDDSLPARGPGRAGNGNFVLNEITATADGKPAPFLRATATHGQDGFVVLSATDRNPATGWAILNQTGRPNHAVFEFQDDLAAGKETTLQVTMHFGYGSHHTLGRFRLAVTGAPRPVRAEGFDGIPPEVAGIVRLDPDRRTDDQKAQLAAFYRSIAPALASERKAVADLKARKDAVEKEIPRTLIAQAVPPRTVRILPRGNWLDDSGPVVAPAVPASLGWHDDPGRRATRLDLARWLVAPENPLVARVAVNRLWMLAFGQGIVTTLEDFGSQGAWPTHPHLLDWLAVEFRESGWDVKATIKRMVLSSTYRQSSVAHDDLRQRDPSNRWLARQGRFRLDAEMIRDNALEVAGLLERRVGGPSVKPYQPEGYWAHLNFPRREYDADHGPNQYRRGLYTWWQRSFLHPSLLAFDACTREECTVQRPRSNTPLQALVLLNDPTYVESARAFGERIVRGGSDGVEPRIHHAYRLALGRAARPSEVGVLTKLYQQHLKTYQSDRGAANDLLHVGDRPAPADLDRAELAAWTSVGRVILNLHETITRN